MQICNVLIYKKIHILKTMKYIISQLNKEDIFITNLRHKEALSEAKTSLNKVMESLELQMPEDFYSIDLMSAYASLGYIIGEEVEEDLVNEIFSKFCMGK